MGKGEIKMLDVRKEFRTGSEVLTILKEVNIEIKSGEVVAIVGPSGSGKSTLLGIMAGLDQPTSGEVWLGDTNITKLSESKMAKIRGELLGFVFQNYNLIPRLSAYENIELALILNNKLRNRDVRIKELLQAVGLEERKQHLPGQMSGGEQQRVAIARALACDPPIVLADEPTGNLDRKSSKQIADLLFDTCRDEGRTLVLVTHDLELAQRADYILRIDDGILVEEVA
ncbi:MAG: ABC transporter ATP-binding protein [Limnochordia bacterium]|jgi:putative ABC transport system ATP-binding protein|nr:ABC transporter ATP-binding protein [Limnochordia bacterium]